MGPLPHNKLEFTVVLEESFAKRYIIYCAFPSLAFRFIFFLLTFDTFFFGSETRSSGGSGSPSGNGKRSKRSFQSKTFQVAISFSTKIPLKSIALTLKAADVDNGAQDAYRVLDIILRQQAASRCHIVTPCSFSILILDYSVLNHVHISEALTFSNHGF